MSLTVFGEIDDRRVGLLDLPGVLFDVLIGFLQPIDIIMSRNVNKKIHREISSNFVLSSFRRNLAKLVSNCGYSGLVQRDNDVLRPGKSILSGSIVLQAVLGEEWVGSDIDLYATFDYITRVRSKFYHDMGFMYAAWPDDNDVDDQCCDYLISKIGSVLESVEVWKSTEAKEPSWKTASDGLNKAHGYCNLSQKSAGSLQVMALKADVGMAEEAIRGFDLDIVMNTFDGTTLFITNPFSIASRVAHTSEYVHMMSQALGDVADPSVDKMDRLDNLSEKGVFRWGTRCGLDEEVCTLPFISLATFLIPTLLFSSYPHIPPRITADVKSF